MKIGKEIIIFTRATRLRAPPGYGGAGLLDVNRCQICRGGAPSGAAGLIVIWVNSIKISYPIFPELMN
jgi:hypothetical protein